MVHPIAKQGVRDGSTAGATSYARSFFVATLFLPNPTETVQHSVGDASYTDAAFVYNEVGACGAFQLSVAQPLPSNVTTVQQTTFSGTGKDVTPYFTLPAGIASLSVQTTSDRFRGWLYHLDDLGGEPVGDGINVYDGHFFDFTFPGNQLSYPVKLPDSGPYLFATDNLSTTDTWTFTFQ
jgi:hypothetical protein